MAEEPHLLFETRSAVAVLTFNRPSKYNSMSGQLLDGLERALDDIERRSDVRALLICATGKHFCTGADIDIVLGCVADGEAAVERWLRRGQHLFRRIEALPIPTVVSIQGLCLAGGLELMLACDIAFCSETARFGDQHVNFGFLPAWGSSERLPRLVGTRRALDLMYSGRLLSSAEAREWGLVNAVIADDNLQSHAISYCETLTTRSRSGLAAMKRMVREGASVALEDAHQRECMLAGRQLLSRDGAEGFEAFREKRKPVFA
ncbi:MAG: enoyl-CoA hydratase/isomerase family protein [Pseudorhodoplanes sp.]|uniref:enoyl-CoA hydratase/isomerase family protein n=1 Tax=Pseudorhodoplanes sp. TaxID=1934341 RepID=UPI003D0B5528